jgi:hypothetical protein
MELLGAPVVARKDGLTEKTLDLSMPKPYPKRPSLSIRVGIVR